jgi:DNA-binding transcriptional ArsR family regulator
MKYIFGRARFGTIRTMAKREPVYTIYGKKELRALASSARQEIIDVLAQMGTVSVPELAQTLGRPADTLYYHLRILRKAGLLETVGSRVRDGRTEALYHARNLNIDYDTSWRTNEKELVAVAKSMLRLGIRDFTDAVRDQETVVGGHQRELWSARKTGRLTQKDLARVNRLIQELLGSASTGSEEGQLYGITVLLTPVNRLRRGPEAGVLRRIRKVR